MIEDRLNYKLRVSFTSRFLVQYVAKYVMPYWFNVITRSDR